MLLDVFDGAAMLLDVFDGAAMLLDVVCCCVFVSLLCHTCIAPQQAQ